MIKAVEYYLLATACFGRFREQEPNIESKDVGVNNLNHYPTYYPQLASHRVFISKLYGDLKRLKGSELQSIHDTLIPKIVRNYSLKESWLSDFREVLQLLLQIKVVSNVIE
jgi:hypothetical protein